MRFRFLLAAGVIAASVTAVLAQQDPIAARKQLMKDNGAQARVAAAIVKGEAPFDLAKAKQVFATFENTAAKFGDLFPPNSKEGGETTAAPKIWEDMNGFKAALAKFGTEAKAANASVKDLESFRASFGAVSRNCGGCHEVYRVKKS